MKPIINPTPDEISNAAFEMRNKIRLRFFIGLFVPASYFLLFTAVPWYAIVYFCGVIGSGWVNLFIINNGKRRWNWPIPPLIYILMVISAWVWPLGLLVSIFRKA